MEHQSNTIQTILDGEKENHHFEKQKLREVLDFAARVKEKVEEENNFDDLDEMKTIEKLAKTPLRSMVSEVRHPGSLLLIASCLLFFWGAPYAMHAHSFSYFLSLFPLHVLLSMLCVLTVPGKAPR